MYKSSVVEANVGAPPKVHLLRSTQTVIESLGLIGSGSTQAACPKRVVADIAVKPLNKICFRDFIVCLFSYEP
jgi:hypothetical protein